MSVISDLLNGYQFAVLRIGGAQRPVKTRGAGVAVFAYEEADDSVAWLTYKLASFAVARDPAAYATRALKGKAGEVAFVASIPEEQRRQVASALEALGVRRRGR